MTSGLIERVPAETMARVYQESLPKIKAAMLEIESALADMERAFQPEYGGQFDLRVQLGHSNNGVDFGAEGFERVADRFKRRAWALLIQKLGIRKLMSSKRAAELDSALRDERYSRHDGDEPALLPEINVDTLYSVLSGMVSSADEFMAEAIHEEYDFWKPERKSEYKTNSGTFALGEKVIRGWMVEFETWGGKRFRPHYNNEKHLIAIDNIFHRLDGKGVPSGYGGPLVDAIKTCGEGGIGETEYFKFRCFKNGNLHLWFKRRDLLQRFNQTCGRNRLPEVA